MKNKWLFLFLSVVVTFLFSGCATTIKESSDIPKIKKANIIDSTAGQPHGILIECDENLKNHSAFKNNIPVYRMESKKIVTNKELLLKFNMEKATNDEDDYVYTSKDGKILTLYPNTNFIYSRNSKFVKFEKDNRTVKQEATKFLKEKGLLPEDFSQNEEVMITTSTSLDPAGNEVKEIVQKEVTYSRKIGGKDVIGLSSISVTFDSDGVQNVSCIFSPSYSAAFESQTVSYEEALSRVKSDESVCEYDTQVIAEDVKAIRLTNVELVYFDDPLEDGLTHIQPCFRFSGTAKDAFNNSTYCAVVIHALPDEVFE